MPYCEICGDEIEDGVVALMGVCDACWEERTENMGLGFIPYEKAYSYDE